MDEYLSVLKKVSLFDDMTEKEIETLLHCFRCAPRQYGDGSILWEAGELVTHVGIVLCGIVEAVQLEESGAEHLEALQQKGSVFGDLLTAAGSSSPVTLRSRGESTILYLPLDDILSDCGKSCPCHVILRRNLLQETARKYWSLRRRMRYLSQTRLEDRVLMFLRDQQADCGKEYFSIPYDRQQMADYLGANRSALSRALGSLQEKGYFTFYRNSFRLTLPKSQGE